MRSVLARRGEGAPAPQVHLHAIWYVEADESYCVEKKRGSLECSWVAVRTLTGMGALRLHSGRSFVLAANSLAVFWADDIAHYAAGKDGWQFVWFEFDLLSDECPLAGQVVEIRMSAQERAELERCLTALGSALPGQCALSDALFCFLLCSWQTSATENSGREATLRQVVALLEKGRRERQSIAQMAREAGMCERSFRDAVHEAVGMSPKAYMLRGEMTAAMELLRTTGMSVSEIAACFNYASPLYFSRVFKKYYGISPLHVRKGIVL